MWEGRRCCSLNRGLGGCSMGISAFSRITCSAFCGTGAGQGFSPWPQLCRYPSKVMDHDGAHLLKSAWSRGVWVPKAGAYGALTVHVCRGPSPRQQRLRAVKRLWDFWPEASFPSH